MPRQSSKSSGDKAEMKTSIMDPSPSGKRSIRWFVHPPTFHFTHQRTTPTLKRSKSPTEITSLETIADSVGPTLTTQNSATTSPDDLRNPLAKRAVPILKKSNPYASEAIFNPLVHQLRRELEEAKEQIKALERVKDLQAKETERIKNEQKKMQSGPPYVSSIDQGIPPGSPNSHGMHFDTKRALAGMDEDRSSTSSCSSESSAHEATSTRHVAESATCALLEETDHPIVIDPASMPGLSEDDVMEGSVEGEEKIRVDPTKSRRPMTPSSMTGPLLWQALAFENVGGIDDENSMNQLDPVMPPMEVMTIRDPPPKEADENNHTGNVAQILAVRLRDAHERANAYRQKLESSQDLVASLFRDLERARRSIQALVTRNISLSRDVKSLKLEKEDHMIHRSSLVKACVYITPVFILCGGLEFFVSAILLVWILVELEASWYLDAEDEDDDDLTNEEEALLKLREMEFPTPIVKDMPIPRNIVLSTVEGNLNAEE